MVFFLPSSKNGSSSFFAPTDGVKSIRTITKSSLSHKNSISGSTSRSGYRPLMTDSLLNPFGNLPNHMTRGSTSTSKTGSSSKGGTTSKSSSSSKTSSGSKSSSSSISTSKKTTRPAHTLLYDCCWKWQHRGWNHEKVQFFGYACSACRRHGYDTPSASLHPRH